MTALSEKSTEGILQGSFWRTWRGVQLAATLLALLLLGCLGGFVFSFLERQEEIQRLMLNRAFYRALTDSVDFKYCHDPVFKEKLGFCREHEQLKGFLKIFFGRAGNSLDDQENWTWLGGFFFVMKVGSTVGYATQGAPQTLHGQAAAIAFGMVAIPLFGYALMLSSSCLWHGVQHGLTICIRRTCHVASKSLPPRLAGDGSSAALARGTGGEEESGETQAKERREELVLSGACLLLILWLGGAALFAVLEGLSFLDALYMCFITLSTVGFGTDVPSTTASRLFFVVYIFFALGLTSGIMRELATQKEEEELPLIGRMRHRVLGTWRAPVALITVCLLGAMVFPLLERKEELARVQHAEDMYSYLYNLAYFDGCDEKFVQNQSFCRNAQWFRNELKTFFGPFTSNSMEDRQLWTFSGSVMFVLSLASTVGYGAQAPHTPGGELATVIFGCIAIPLFGYCMLQFSSVVSSFVEQQIKMVIRRTSRGPRHDAEYHESVSIMAHAVLVVILWIGGAFILPFVDVHDRWTFTTALYFCFVTLTTIGFSNVMPHGILARCFLLIYIFMGLGTCTSFISLVLRRFERVALAHEEHPETAADAKGTGAEDAEATSASAC